MVGQKEMLLPIEGKRGKAGQCLRQHDKNCWYIDPRNNKAERCAEHPGERRIKNEAWLAESVIGAIGPSRKENAVAPLCGGIHP